VYYKRHLWTLAIAQLQESVAKDPGNAQYQFHLGMAYVETGNKVLAREALTKALSINPQFDGAKEAREALEKLRG